MKQPALREVEKCLDEYSRLAAGSDALQLLSAIARYGEAERWLEQVLDDALRRQCQDRLPVPELPTLAGAARGLVERIEQNLETLSIGSRFEYEELVLLLTHAVDIELACEVLERRAMLPPNVQASLAALKEGLRTLADSRESRQPYLSAIAQIRRVHKLRSDWLWADDGLS